MALALVVLYTLMLSFSWIMYVVIGIGIVGYIVYQNMGR